MRFLMLFSVLVLLYSCQEPISAEFGMASAYFPPKLILQEGIVNSFHVTRYQEKQDPYTDILYTKYLLRQDTLILTNYDAGFSFKNERQYVFKENKMILLSRTAKDQRNNQTVSKVSKNSFLSWDNSIENSNIFFSEEAEFFTRQIAISQDYIIDTTKLGIAAKKIKTDYKIQVQYSTDTASYSGIDEKFYALGKGEVYYRSTYDDVTVIGELVEQLSAREFDKKANHDVKRIGYINPDKIADINGSFQPCSNNENDYFDYYNGDPDGHLKGNKGRVQYFIDSLLSREILANQSGHISVRFMINCEGEVGYFTTEEADLDYKPKSFPAAVSKHLMEITSEMHPWIACVIRGEPRDSYAYIMYTIKNGEITNIIP